MDYRKDSIKFGKGLVGGTVFALGVYQIANWRNIQGLLVFLICAALFFVIMKNIWETK